MEFEYYQDKEGNIYELKTNLKKLLVHEIFEQAKEIERLNNIINEKNKEIEDYSNKWCELAKAKTKSDNIINELENELYEFYVYEGYNNEQIKDKLQELKGEDKNVE